MVVKQKHTHNGLAMEPTRSINPEIKVVQTETLLLITIFGIESDVDATIEPDAINIKVCGHTLLQGKLFETVDKSQSRVRNRDGHVMIKLRKKSAGQWPSIFAQEVKGKSLINIESRIAEDRHDPTIPRHGAKETSKIKTANEAKSSILEKGAIKGSTSWGLAEQRGTPKAEEKDPLEALIKVREERMRSLREMVPHSKEMNNMKSLFDTVSFERQTSIDDEARDETSGYRCSFRSYAGTSPRADPPGSAAH